MRLLSSCLPGADDAVSVRVQSGTDTKNRESGEKAAYGKLNSRLFGRLSPGILRAARRTPQNPFACSGKQSTYIANGHGAGAGELLRNDGTLAAWLSVAGDPGPPPIPIPTEPRQCPPIAFMCP